MTEIHQVDSNLRECFRALASLRGNGERRTRGGIEILSLGVRFQMFNAAFLAFPVETETDLEGRVAAATVHFGARGIDWSFWLCDGLLTESVLRRAPKIFARHGLTLATQMPGMALATLPEPDRFLPLCEVREVDSMRTLQHFRSIGAASFRVPQDWFEEVFDEKTPSRRPFRAWVAYAGGVPVTTAATVTSHGVTGFYNVATSARYRGLGYAEAIMRQCCAIIDIEGQSLPLVLQSTGAGLRLYGRLGFVSVTRFRVWSS